MANNDAHYLFYAANRDDAVLARIELRYSSGAYQVRNDLHYNNQRSDCLFVYS